MSTNWLIAAAPPPKMLVLPPAAVDLGEAEAAIELWEHYSHKTLDDTQRLVVQVMMALAADGLWAAATTGREMARQNGKGDEVEVVELWGLVQRAEAILHTVHDAVLLASQTQQRMLGVLESHADLRRRVKRKWQGTGQQMIELRNGGVIWYRTRTGGGGRGVDDIDRLVVDEAQHATEEQLAAVSPTLLANPNPQLNAMGTAALAGQSRWWWGMRKRALSADPGRFGYVGHTAETVYLDENGRVVQEPVDPSDRSRWPGCNPALASGRGGGMAFLEEQYLRLPGSFAGEHLCVWEPPDDEDGGARWELWSKSAWSACATKEDPDQAAKPGWITDPTYAIEMPANRSGYAVAAAGPCREGGIGWEIVALDDIGSTLRPWLKAQGIKSVVLDVSASAPTATLADGLRADGITIIEASFGDLKKATGDSYDAVVAGEVVHRNNPHLDPAVAGATKRKSGDVSLIDRYGPGWLVNAVILARWGHQKDPEPAGFAMILGGSE